MNRREEKRPPELDEKEQNSLTGNLLWLTGKFFSGSRRDLLLWLARYFDDSTRQRLAELLNLDNSDRVEAEEALAAFLETSPTAPQPRVYLSADIGRNVDWGRTMVDSAPARPHKFWNRAIIHAPDIKLLSALLNLAWRWCDELSLFLTEEGGDRASRVEVLTEAIRKAEIDPLPMDYDANAAAALWALPGGEALSFLIDKATTALDQDFDPTKDESILNIFKNASTTEENANAALEVIAAVSLARAAWRIGWRKGGRDLSQDWKLQHGLELEKEGLRLQIGKGTLEDANDDKEKSDRSRAPLEQIGYKATGKQPDIYLKFFEKDDPNKMIYIIGDAKRNAAEGDAYIAPSFWAIVNYFVAFGHLMGLKLGPARNDFFEGPISPAGIIFFKQGPEERDEEACIIGLYFDKGEFGNPEEEPEADKKLTSVLSSIECQVHRHFAFWM